MKKSTRVSGTRQLLAKLLVLCMVFGLVPTVAMAAGGCEFTAASSTGGSAYVVVGDTETKLGSTAYEVTADTATIKLEADSGYKAVTDSSSSSSYYIYTLSNDTTGTTYITSTSMRVNVSEYKSIQVHPVFTSTSSSSSSGGSSSSSDKVTVEQPATSGGTTTVEVSVSTKTSGSTTSATVSQSNMNKAVNSAVAAAAAAGTEPAIVVNVETSEKTTAVNVSLPVKSLETLAEADGATLSITSGVADVVLDSASTEALAEQATGGTVTVSVAPVSSSSLNSAQKEAVQGATVINVSVTSGSKNITDFGGGVLAISVAYTLPDGVTGDQVQVFYLTDNGDLQPHETTFANKKATFTTTHLSKYVIGTKSMIGVEFEDVLSGQYYFNAVAWAARNQITAGVSATMFAPDKTCTRAEIVSFLWRSAGSPEPASDDNPFTDVDSDAYYYKAVMWAVEEGVTAGTSATTFSPDKTCTRAEAMAFLYRAEGSPAASGGVGSFTDVPADAYYNSAVVWAVKSKITAGTSETTFSPDKTCTRAEIVTFLYNNANA